MVESLKRFGWIVGHVAAVMVFYTFFRLVFIAHNWSTLGTQAATDLIGAAIHGWRFDLSAVVLINLPFVIVWISGAADRGVWPRVLAAAFWFWNSLLFAANLVDVELYNFTGKRLTFDFFKLGSDWRAQGVQLVVHYWFLALLTALSAAALGFWVRRHERLRPDSAGPWGLRAGVGLLAVLISGLAVRGGWQLKPLRPNHAYAYASPDLGVMSLNSTFTLMRSRSTRALEARRDFKDPGEVVRRLRAPFGVRDKWPRATNVVILILESFSTEYLGWEPGHPSYTPFLNELKSQALVFDLHFANGRRSIEAVPALLAGVPSWMEEPLITSSFQTNEVIGLADLFRRQGHATHFFHGAENGSMFFDTYSRRLGFDQYHGLNEYPEELRQRDFDGSWGIFDEPYLNYVADVLDRHSTPFFATVFTLTSHQPYRIPPRYEGRFPEGSLEVHKAVGYADHAVRKFFERARATSWYANTLFVITADHTHKLVTPEFNNPLGQYRVPMMLYHPSRALPPVEANRVVQHVDLMPSLVDLFGLPADQLNLFGRSYWSPAPGRAVNRRAQGFWWMDRDQVVEWDGAGRWLKYAHRRGFQAARADSETVGEKTKEEFKAAIQYYVNGLLENDWYRAALAAD